MDSLLHPGHGLHRHPAQMDLGSRCCSWDSKHAYGECVAIGHLRSVDAAGELAPSRSRRWSPTRSAFAMAVSAGLTAPMLGKKLVSTTYRLSTSCARQLTSR